MNTKNNNYIKYNIKINKYFSNRNASIIIDRLEYWFGINKFNNGFYKYFEPCKSITYRKGDSWAEETGLPRRAFKKVFNLIGTYYNSKSNFKKEKDPFKGKLYVAYYDRAKNKIFFLRNHKLVQEFFIKLKNSFQDIKENIKKKKNTVIKNLNDTKCHSQTDTLCRSPYIQENTSNNLSRNKRNLQKKLNPYVHELNKIDLDKNKDLVDDLKKIWKEEVGELLVYNKQTYITKQLVYAYQHVFFNNQYSFRLYARKISSSKFLMGEKTDFKARTDWLLNPYTISKIEEGTYSVGDRQTEYLKQNELNKKEREKQDISLLELESSSNIISLSRLYLIQRFGYAIYYSWFKQANYQELGEKVKITGNTGFIDDYINNNFIAEINFSCNE